MRVDRAATGMLGGASVSHRESTLATLLLPHPILFQKPAAKGHSDIM